MTNSPLPLSDEDLSAYLDNEVTPKVRARIDGDPSAQERVRAMGAARDALRTAPIAPLPAATVDSLIARALAELDSPTGSASTDASASPAPPADAVTPPTFIQQGRRGRSSSSTTWMVAAAVVALVVVGMGLVWSGVQSTETTDTAGTAATEADQQAARQNESASGEAEDSSADAAPTDAGEAHGAFPEPVPVSTEPADLIDLGEAANGAALRTSLRNGLPTDAEVTTSDAMEGAAADAEPITVGQVDRCAQILELQVAPDSDLAGVGLASVAGEPHLVYEFVLPESDDSGDHLIAAVDPASCAALITFVR